MLLTDSVLGRNSVRLLACCSRFAPWTAILDPSSFLANGDNKVSRRSHPWYFFLFKPRTILHGARETCTTNLTANDERISKWTQNYSLLTQCRRKPLSQHKIYVKNYNSTLNIISLSSDWLSLDMILLVSKSGHMNRMLFVMKTRQPNFSISCWRIGLLISKCRVQTHNVINMYLYVLYALNVRFVHSCSADNYQNSSSLKCLVRMALLYAYILHACECMCVCPPVRVSITSGPPDKSPPVQIWPGGVSRYGSFWGNYIKFTKMVTVCIIGKRRKYNSIPG